MEPADCSRAVSDRLRHMFASAYVTLTAFVLETPGAPASLETCAYARSALDGGRPPSDPPPLGREPGSTRLPQKESLNARPKPSTECSSQTESCRPQHRFSPNDEEVRNPRYLGLHNRERDR